MEAPPIAILNPAGDGLASRRIPEGTKLANALAIAQAEFKEKWERGLLTRDVYDAPIWSDLKTVLSRTPPVAPEEVSKAAPDWQRRWLLTQAAALLPIKEYLAIMEVFVVAFADDQVKARELSGYLHPMGPSGRYSLIEDNWNHPKIRSIRAKIAASEVKRLGLAPEVAAVLKEHLSSESPVQQDIPPHRKLNAAGDNFEEPPPKR